MTRDEAIAQFARAIQNETKEVYDETKEVYQDYHSLIRASKLIAGLESIGLIKFDDPKVDDETEIASYKLISAVRKLGYNAGTFNLIMKILSEAGLKLVEK